MASPFNVPNAAPKAPKADAAPVEAADAAPVEKKEKKKKAPNLTPEQIEFIFNNVKNMSYKEMADQIGVTTSQVNRTLATARKHIKAKLEAGELSKEQAEKALDALSRPEDTRPGRRKGDSVVKKAITEKTDNLIADILGKM